MLPLARVTCLLLLVCGTVCWLYGCSFGIRNADDQPAMFVYIVDATKPQRGEFAVTLMPRGLQFREEEIFSLPAWAPGAYQLVHYGQYLRNLMAFDHRGEPLTVIKVDSNSWKIRPATQLSRLQYCITQMHRPDLLYPETTELNAQRGYFNGTNVFGYLHGYKDLPCMVQYRLPEGWQMASAIETAPNSQTAHARDYDELVDAPVMLGKFQRYDFTLLGKLHSVVIDADAKPMPDSLLALIKEIIVTHHRFFGELPYSKYLFLFRLVKPKTFWQFGALEHRNSSAYYMPLFDWDAVRYDPIATTISHEFFHLWNPKRFRSHLLGPFDYQHPIRTSTMWFVEGVTDYYAELLMVKGGIMSPQVFLRNMLERIRLMHLPKKRESLVALSRRLAYIEDNSEMFPFYTRGTVVAMLLDIYLRTHHPARCGTDELLQKLNLEYGKPEKPYHDDSLVTVLSCLAQVDIEPFYTRFIAGTDTLPLHAYFSKAGFYYGKRRRAVPQMGYFIQLDSSGALKVASVLPESAAERMGLKPDDEILAIDDVDTSRSSTLLERIFSLEGLKAGARVQIRVNRRGKVVKLTGRVGAQQSTVEVLELNEHATPLEAEVRRRMLTFQN